MHLQKGVLRVLLFDQDPQANATTLLLKTKLMCEDQVFTFKQTLMVIVQDNDLSKIFTKIISNLYLLPTFSDFAQYPKVFEKKFDNEVDRVTHLLIFLEPLKDDFDYYRNRNYCSLSMNL